MKKSAIWGAGFGVVALAGVAVFLYGQKRQAERYRAPFRRYGVQVFSPQEDQKADKRREEYIRRAQLLRTGFEGFARANQGKIKTLLAEDEDPKKRASLVATILPWRPSQAIPNWKAACDSLSASDLETRQEEAYVFTWNAVSPQGADSFQTVKAQGTLKNRNNYIVAESLIGKESITFWVDGSITEELARDRYGVPEKSGHSKKIADGYDFLKKGG